MDLKLEVVVVPVTDVDKAKHFYGKGLACRDDAEWRATGADPKGRSYGSCAAFCDPDGNGWLLQEISERLPGRV